MSYVRYHVLLWLTGVWKLVMNLNLSTRTVPLPSDHMYEEEADLLADVTKWLEPQRRDGIMLIRVCDMFNKGYADLFLCVRGIFVVAELKDNVGTPTPHQRLFIRDIKECGGIGAVCRTVKEVADLVDEAKRRAALCQ